MCYIMLIFKCLHNKSVQKENVHNSTLKNNQESFIVNKKGGE